MRVTYVHFVSTTRLAYFVFANLEITYNKVDRHLTKYVQIYPLYLTSGIII